MQQRYTLDQAASLLCINRATLRRWLLWAKMKTQRDALDHRWRYLSRTQLILLANLHHRVVVDQVREDIEERLSELERRIVDLEHNKSRDLS